MYQKTVLSNGLRIITNDLKQRESIAIGFWVGVGGRYESDNIKGVAHFLEHIVFKGSKKYGCEEIKERIEGVGGNLNAFTSEEQTCYYAKIPSQHLNQTFDVLSDMVFFPNIKANDVKKECGVILEEIKMYHDLPQYYVMELLDGIIWPDHPLGKSLAGSAQSVSGLTNKSIKLFHQEYYSPENIVISVCGKVNHQKIVDLARRKLARVSKKECDDYIKVNQAQTKPRSIYYKKDIEQMHVALGMPGIDENHKDRYALSLLNVVLGGNMSSRLFVEIREKRGLAYSISSGTKMMHDTGLFLIRAGVDNQKVVQTVKVVISELEKIKREGVTQDEFKRARDYLIGQLQLGLEDTMDHMLWIGDSCISKDKKVSLAQVMKAFGKITRADIKRVAKDVFDRKRYSLAVVGPLTKNQEAQMDKLLGV